MPDYLENVCCVFQRGSTALHMACRRHHVGIALVLLHHGCQFDVVDHVSFNQIVVVVIAKIYTIYCPVL